MERYLDILPNAQQLAAWQQTNLTSDYTQLATGRGDEPHLLHSRRVLTHYSLNNFARDTLFCSPTCGKLGSVPHHSG